MIGTTVSHYKILEKIGEGGMGEVYLAEDTKLRRQVALKFLPEDLTRDEDRKQRFIQEARAAAAIQHPHIAAVYDIDDAESRTFLAMEYIPGQTLREVIEAKDLTSQRSLELGSQIAEGLAKAHEKGVVHRDIKPDNVLISEDGYAKIIDFGLAKLVEPLTPGGEDVDPEEADTQLKTREGLVMGTVAYMSPEQAVGESLDARSDIFSFGVVLYEMLSGRSPFRRKSAVASMSALLKESPPPLTLRGAETPPELERLIGTALAKERSERYQSMKDLALDLKKLREGSRSVSRPAAAAAPGVAKPKWLWAAVPVAIAGLIAVTFYLGGRQPAAAPGIGASGRPAIAVMYFESMSGDEEIRWLSKGLPNMLVTDLAQTPGLDVVSSQRIHEILTAIGQEDLETINKSLVPEIAQRAGVGAVVVGSIFKSGPEIRLDVQVQDVGSGRVLSAESVRGNDVFPLVDELTDRIRASLDLGDRPAGRPIAEVTTSSLEAFQLYSKGQEAQESIIRHKEARKFFEEAVKVDPSFTMAYFQLWRYATIQGDRALSEQYRQKVLANLDRLSERKKLLARAYDHRVQGKLEEAANLLEGLLALYPDERLAYFQLQGVYRELSQPEKRFATIERGVKAIPHYGWIRNAYGYQLLKRARYAEGIRELETYAKLYPDESNPHYSLGEAYLLTGQPEKALEKYTRAVEIVDPSRGFCGSGCAWAYGMLGRYDEALAEMRKGRSMHAFTLSRVGRYREAEKSIREAAELAVSQGSIGAEVECELLSAVWEIEKGNAADAITRIRRTQDSIPQVNPVGLSNDYAMVAHLLAGIAEVQRENLEAARDHLDSQSKIYKPQSDRDVWMFHTLQGEIALAAGELAAAESAFLAGEPELKMSFAWSLSHNLHVFVNNLTFRDGLARVKIAQGDLPAAIAIYRALNTLGITAKYTAMVEPRFFLETARLLDETGDKAGARVEYERFLELWKNADEGLPELKEARGYVAK